MKELSFVLAIVFLVMPVCCAQDGSHVAPESGFLSTDKYTNAFFGFSLPLPQDQVYHIARVSSSGSERHLFGLAGEKGLTVFDISAQRMNSELADQLMRAANRTMIKGREFSKGVSQQKKPKGILWKIMYLTAIDGYLLEFNIQSSDANIAEGFQHCVEATDFFDPAKAKAIAGAESKPYNPAVRAK
jgi:hypothetical protein